MNEAHQRFHAWLTAGAEGEPRRDVAVHASVCPECRRSIAALDRLAIVNPSMASIPAKPTGREYSPLAVAARLVGPTAVLFSAAILGVGVSQLIGMSHTNAPVAQVSPTPDQNVLGETATPQPSPEASPTPGETPQETLTPLGTPVPKHPLPLVTPIPWVPPPPTPLPTVPLSSPVPTPVPTAVPTPEPTAVPTATPPTDSDSDGVSDADEATYGSNPFDPSSTPENSQYAAATCTDLVDNDRDGFVDALDTVGCPL